MSRTTRKHAPLSQLTTRRDREEDRIKQGLKSHKQRRSNERVKIRKELSP